MITPRKRRSFTPPFSKTRRSAGPLVMTRGQERPPGSVMTVEFELEGQQFVGLNGGPMFKFTEAVSFVVNCEDQKEVDYFWSKLSAGGEESRCGWLKDKFGLSWQAVPTVLTEMLADNDTVKAKRVTHAMLQMDKIDIPTLQKAYDGK